MGFWKIKSFFTKAPKDLGQLRQHQEGKLGEYYESGNFHFVMRTKADDKPILLISSDLKTPIKPQYLKLAEPKKKDQYIEGTYTSDKRKRIYRFAPHPDYVDRANKSKPTFKRHQSFVADPLFSVNVWALLLAYADPDVVEWNGGALQQRKLGDCWVELGPFSVPDVLKNHLDFVPESFRLPNDFEVSVRVQGKMAKKAQDDPLLAAVFYEPAFAAVKESAEEIVQALRKIDDALGQAKIDMGKAQKQVDGLVKSFQKSFDTACARKLEEAWEEHLTTFLDYRDYRIAGAKSIVSQSVSLVAAAAGGIGFATTGVGLAAGILGTIKEAVLLTRQIVMLGMEADTLLAKIQRNMHEELKEQLDYTEKSKEMKALQVSFETAKQVASRLSGWTPRGLPQIGGDLTQWKSKIKGLYVKSAEAAQQLQAALDEAEPYAQLIADAEAQDEISDADKKLIASHKRIQQELEGRIHKLLVFVAGGPDPDDPKKTVRGKMEIVNEARTRHEKALDEMLKTLKKGEPDHKKVIRIFTPLADLAFVVAGMGGSAVEKGQAFVDVVGKTTNQIKLYTTEVTRLAAVATTLSKETSDWVKDEKKRNREKRFAAKADGLLKQYVKPLEKVGSAIMAGVTGIDRVIWR